MSEEPRFHQVLHFAIELTLVLAAAAAFGLIIFLAGMLPNRQSVPVTRHESHLLLIDLPFVEVLAHTHHLRSDRGTDHSARFAAFLRLKSVPASIATPVTIDMHRDPSLRESAAYAHLRLPTRPELRLPSSSDRSRYTATRNLPNNNLPQAVVAMSTDLAAVPDLKRKQQRRPGRFTKKPALCYTAYWEGDYSQKSEANLTDQSLEFRNAKRLQTILIGRSVYTETYLRHRQCRRLQQRQHPNSAASPITI